MILLDPLARPVIAHRGASGHFPENTLMAFQEGIDLGADAVELDVRLTADGCPVVMHDSRVDRTTGGAGEISCMPLAAVRELDAGCGERVPTLREVLEALDPVPIIVEVKEARDASAIRTAISAAGAVDRVMVGSFQAAALDPFRRAGIATVATRYETGWMWVKSRLRWLGGVGRASYEGFSIPEYSWRLRVADEAFVKSARRMDLPVHVWTVDDVATARRLRRLGVAGIITNFPDRMIDLGADA